MVAPAPRTRLPHLTDRLAGALRPEEEDYMIRLSLCAGGPGAQIPL